MKLTVPKCQQPASARLFFLASKSRHPVVQLRNYAASMLEWARQIFDGRMDYGAATTDTVATLLERLEQYDGTTAVVRTEHLSADEVEFLRWRAERWMKLRHMPVAFAHSPLFLLRNAPKMFAHTFRGSTIRSFLGLEDERNAFQRFQAIRRAERAYV